MTDIAKAIQQQTNELATLVKAQQETTTGAGGSLKSLGKTSEELVFLLRGCGQYTVQVGNEEYGAPLAQALLAAQAGSSTKLRSAGFRQKVTFSARHRDCRPILGNAGEVCPKCFRFCALHRRGAGPVRHRE